jgi:arylsulfatase A-like enzyme
LPTVAELIGAELPQGVPTDGLSLVDFLLGGPAPTRDYFYWELHEGRPIQAVRFGDWKAVRNGPGSALELYDLAQDIGETTDIAADHPDLVEKAERLMNQARVDDPKWPLTRPQPKNRKKTR